MWNRTCKIKSVFRDVKWCFNAPWGLKGLKNWNCAITSKVIWNTSPTPWWVFAFLWYWNPSICGANRRDLLACALFGASLYTQIYYIHLVCLSGQYDTAWGQCIGKNNNLILITIEMYRCWYFGGMWPDLLHSVCVTAIECKRSQVKHFTLKWICWVPHLVWLTNCECAIFCSMFCPIKHVKHDTLSQWWLNAGPVL